MCSALHTDSGGPPGAGNSASIRASRSFVCSPGVRVPSIIHPAVCRASEKPCAGARSASAGWRLRAPGRSGARLEGTQVRRGAGGFSLHAGSIVCDGWRTARIDRRSLRFPAHRGPTRMPTILGEARSGWMPVPRNLCLVETAGCASVLQSGHQQIRRLTCIDANPA